jgi:hypothetical protein
MHAAAFCCLSCGRFRGWLSVLQFNWLAAVAAKRGVSNEPIVLRNWNTTRGHVMTETEKNTTTAASCFATRTKQKMLTAITRAP